MQYSTALAAHLLEIGSPMFLVYVSLLLFGLGVIIHIVGQCWLAYYGFKFNGGIGIGVLLVPIVTAWFAFFKLEKEGKETPIMLWLGGFMLAVVTLAGFFGPLTDGLTGKAFAEGYLKPKVVAVVPSTPVAPKVETPVAPATPDAGAATADGGAAAPAGDATPNTPAADGGAVNTFR